MMASEQHQATTDDQSRRPPTVLLVRAKKPSPVMVETGFSVVSAYVERRSR